MNSALKKIKIIKDGPYWVAGELPLSKLIIGANEADESVRWEQGEQLASHGQYALCRCGHSAKKPFCDGTHQKFGFDGTETASRRSYSEQAVRLDGPSVSLSDAENLCGFARFCDPHGTVWRIVKQTDTQQVKEQFLKQVCDCPSGRLVAIDNNSGEPIEPAYEPSIALIEDPAQQCSGPIWVRGGVQIEASDGFQYEIRNRVTLCRCGESNNKPFCDGTHAAIKFRDS